jgi:hypothetical protein
MARLRHHRPASAIGHPLKMDLLLENPYHRTLARPRTQVSYILSKFAGNAYSGHRAQPIHFSSYFYNFPKRYSPALPEHGRKLPSACSTEEGNKNKGEDAASKSLRQFED